jgi:hypothetical protein
MINILTHRLHFQTTEARTSNPRHLDHEISKVKVLVLAEA